MQRDGFDPNVLWEPLKTHHETQDGASLEQSDPALMVDLLQGSQ